MTNHVPKVSESRNERTSPQPPIAIHHLVRTHLPLRRIPKMRTLLLTWPRFKIATRTIPIPIPHPHPLFLDAEFQRSRKRLGDSWRIHLHWSRMTIPFPVSLSMCKLLLPPLTSRTVHPLDGEAPVSSSSRSQPLPEETGQSGEYITTTPDQIPVCSPHTPGPSPGPSTRCPQPSSKKIHPRRRYGGVEIPSIRRKSTPPLRRSARPIKLTEKGRYELEDKARYDTRLTYLEFDSNTMKGTGTLAEGKGDVNSVPMAQWGFADRMYTVLGFCI